MADHAIAVDLGGTKVAAAIVEASGRLRQRVQVDTPSDSAQSTVSAVVRAITGVGRAADGVPVGVGAAGLVDPDGTVVYAPNLTLQQYPLQRELADRLDREVVVTNDANAATWGEYRLGAARNAASAAVMLTVGTGIGGGHVLGDRLTRGAGGLGAEFGHMIVAEGNRRCACGNRGCLEAMASGTAIARTVLEWMDRGRLPADSALWAAGEISGAAVGQAALDGDAAALAAVAECGRWLGVGIASLVNALDPEIVVVGGGVAALGDLLLAPAVEASEERLLGRSYRDLPPVRAGELGANAGLVGAGLLALERV